MYLKSLELLGFKSFAPKTILNFHRGVTCVVGPNGCGKSNVLDGIRWVLGEQSAKALRGGEMADVIFSGTDSRGPMGMAEVTMTFSECEAQLGVDWSEVAITRRVFRDGGSEYLLNKTPCRLRDIHNLFMDTGIGRSAYSIMEQGKIDQILSSRPEDRRAIFEEAAGITKFKSQKKEALRKLEATEANLIRLQDIVKEVKRQIGSLQRQAGKARRYQVLLADLKMLETHSAKRQWDALELQRTGVAEELAALVHRIADGESEIARQEGEVELHRAALEEMEGRLEEARRVVNDLRTRIANQESRLVFNQEKVAEFAQLTERYRTEVAGGEEKLRIAETQLHQTDAELEVITAMLAVELRHMEEKQAAVSALLAQRRAAETALAGVAHEAGRLEQRIASVRGQISSVGQQRDGADARLGIIGAELEGLAGSLEHIGDQRSGAQAELTLIESGLTATNEAVAAAEIELRTVQSSVASLDAEQRTMQRTLAERESKADVLRRLIEAGEGFGAGTQAVLRGLDDPNFFKPAIAGALAQYIDVDPEWVPAVEAALGLNLQTIVMKDTMVAEAVIRVLTTKKLGTASLALRDLDAVFSHVESGELRLPEGAIDWLINKVKAQPEVERLIERLINHTVLVPDLETALRLFPQHGSALVTLSGEVLTGSGIVHGGRAGAASNSLLERKNELATTGAEAARLRALVLEATVRRDAFVSQIEGTQARLDDARAEKQLATTAASTLRGQLAALERELREGERKAQHLEGERAASASRHAEASKRLDGLETEVQEGLLSLDDLQERRTGGAQKLEQLRVQEAEVSAELNELKVRVATERQRHSSLHHQRLPMEARLVELGELIVQRQRDIAMYEQRAAATATENAEMEVTLGDLRGRIGEASAEVGKLQDERAAIAAAAESAGHELRILRSQLTHNVDQRSRLEVRGSQLEMKTTALGEHILKRYQLDLATFERDLHALRLAVREALKKQRSGPEEAAGTAEVPVEHEEPERNESFDIDWERVEALVRELDTRIDGMGPVNIEAISEYDELEERYAFLEKQNNDLNASKTELMEVIRKINNTTRQLFAETFEKVRVNFQEMFGELFGGGKANLLLTDESDPLESGIDIIAKPPGKQLQNITLLSGGEKTMTAVAMLFAIYMVKPSPFCVLDEMDAPLDESNIARFIRILDRFVGQSQFVVISHNKRTIARADALYGVTMEEHGVSKIVGVKFARRDESAESNDVLGTTNPSPVQSVAEVFGKSESLLSESVA